ncbi:helix-turn-helix transcriptional regulator [Paenibacillus sp. 481]|uniref:helix-turn-helix transcriptional regulator n=1 Tax=Paenibacillus sp. 481 TaxID=2835869 RepID=UPI001E5EEF44|nr:YafY family protein [Paenibacillus sp. 481]UHA72189.1 YafY family transcriptional regulator [Paenibacillus sp. 481]
MKIDRLLSIVILLLNRRIVQAKELADLHEVSVRTIYRDIDAINQAGIPIVTYQGASGGIGLAEGYRLDRNVMTNDELATMVTALNSISSSYEDQRNQQLLQKINSIIPPSQAEQFQMKTQQFIVDFSPWGKHSYLEEKLTLLKQAIEQLRTVSLTYCNANGDMSERTVEPYTLVLKRQTWYLYAFCRQREQFRLFKLFRMKQLAMLDTTFVRQHISFEELPWEQQWYTPEHNIEVKLRFSKQVRHLAEEWFGVEQLVADDNGTYLVTASYPEDNWLYGFILSFGPDVEVLEPAHIRAKIRASAEAIFHTYK